MFSNSVKIYLVIAIIFTIIIGGIYLLIKSRESKLVVCTMEAKLCPDGSSVGRTGPNCEFAQCPNVAKSGIKGLVLLGPMCSVAKDPPDPQCEDKPYKTNLVATKVNQSEIFKEFNSNSKGKFSVDLAPGQYLISSSVTAGIFSHCSSNGPIKVVKNKYTDITVSCDTGIR